MIAEDLAPAQAEALCTDACARGSASAHGVTVSVDRGLWTVRTEGRAEERVRGTIAALLVITGAIRRGRAT